MEKKHFNLIAYFLISIVIVNAVLNFFINDFKIYTEYLNIYDLLAGFLLFVFLYFVGRIIKNIFHLSSVSIGIVLYLFSFFFLDIVSLFFYTQISFNEIFIVVNIIWLVIVTRQKKNYEYLAYSIFSYFLLNYFVDSFIEKLTKNNKLIGDVEAVFFEQSKNIFEYSYFFSVNNYVMEGYPQFISYFQSLFLKISSNIIVYDFLAFTSHIVFYLTILLFFELKISHLNKYLLIVTFSLAIFNSDWLQFLFTTSLMSEGLVSLFTAVTIYNVFENLENKNKFGYINYFLLGLLYFSKQFNSLIVMIVLVFLFILNQNKKLILFGFIGLILKELLYIFVFKGVSKDHHIKQIDLGDTVIDLITFTDLKIYNISLILKNLWIDKPITILFIIFYFLFIGNYLFSTNIERNSYLYFLIVNINFIFIFALYISVWRNMELESPIRYMLNFFHLMLISSFSNLNFLTKK